MLLEQAIKKAEANPSPTAKQQAWLKKAKSALEVPDAVTHSMIEYTHDPADVYRWRTAMAEALTEERQ
jgi:hypothetical protein